MRDLQWDPNSPDRCSITVVVVASKCNKSGPSEEVIIKAAGSRSGVSLLKQYASTIKLHEASDAAPLFPLVTKHSSGAVDVYWNTPTDKADHFVPAIRALLQAAGFESSEFSGHSFRAGGATDLWTAGCRPEVIKRHGR